MRTDTTDTDTNRAANINLMVRARHVRDVTAATAHMDSVLREQMIRAAMEGELSDDELDDIAADAQGAKTARTENRAKKIADNAALKSEVAEVATGDAKRKPFALAADDTTESDDEEDDKMNFDAAELDGPRRALAASTAQYVQARAAMEQRCREASGASKPTPAKVHLDANGKPSNDDVFARAAAARVALDGRRPRR